MFLDNLSTALLRICGEKDLTYETAAERCGLSSRYFGSITRRRTAPSLDTLEKICVGFQKAPNELLLLSVEQELSYRQPMVVCETRRFQSSQGLTGYPVCPRCGISLDREHQHYCDRCGQLLEWSYYDSVVESLTEK